MLIMVIGYSEVIVDNRYQGGNDEYWASEGNTGYRVFVGRYQGIIMDTRYSGVLMEIGIIL